MAYDSKSIWQYFLKWKITVTAEYLPGPMDREAQAKEGLKQMETEPEYLQTVVSGQGYSRNWPNCTNGVTPTTSVHVMENRSLNSGRECITVLLGSQVCLCILSCSL